LVVVLVAGCSDGTIGVRNAVPEAEILSHDPGDSVIEGETVEFKGHASDADNHETDLVAHWFVDGATVEECADLVPEENGNVNCFVQIPPQDTMEVALHVLDPRNELAKTEVDLVIHLTEPPTAEVVVPEGDEDLRAETPFQVEGIASDAEDAASDLTVTWSSDVDGELDAGDTTPASDGTSSGSVSLSQGAHALTMLVTDTSGKTATDLVLVDVGPPIGEGPVVSIEQPGPNRTLMATC